MKSIALLLVGVLLGGCATLAFSPHFRDNELADVKNALGGLKIDGKNNPTNDTQAPLVFLLSKAPTKIVAFDLHKQKNQWTVSDDARTRIIVGKRHIYYGAAQGGKTFLVARNISDGKRVWSTPIDDDGRLLGLTTDGNDVYYVTEFLSRGTSGKMADLIAVDGETGKILWQRSSKGRLGAPSAQGGRIFLPFRFQAISILDAKDGRELARIRSKKETMIWVRSTPQGILFGGKNGIYRLDEKAISGTPEGSHFFTAHLPATVLPAYWWDGYNAALVGYTAYDRNRLLWLPRQKEPMFQNHTIFVHHYRFFFAFDTTPKEEKRSQLKWAFAVPRSDVVASTYTGKAVLLITGNGRLIALDAEGGGKIFQKDLGIDLLGATFDALGFLPEGRPQKTKNLRQALTEVIWDPDRRFQSVKLFCIEELAHLKGTKVAKDLVNIITHEGIDPEVYKRAGEVLVQRREKSAIPLYLATLKSHYNFFRGTRAKAVDVLARALGELRAPDAVSPLLLHFADHETPIYTLEQIVRALISIGDKTILEPFRDFLLTYRCEPMFQEEPATLNLISEALLTLGGENERQLLTFVENDPHTIGTLKTYLGEVLRQSPPENRGKGVQNKKNHP